jgi:dTDP-glucose pyrophosphorylase
VSAPPLRDVAPLIVSLDDSLRAAMQRLDAGAAGLVLVVDAEGRLIATLTDGDVRRAILRGESLDAPVSSVAHHRPVTAREGATREEVVQIFRERAVRQLPFVDRVGRPVALCLASDISTATQPYPVVLMAGGRGSRLGELTTQTPKPLVHVGGRPILEILIGQLAAEGFVELIVTLNYLSDRLRHHFGDGAEFGVHIDYVDEPEPLGTAGALSVIADRLRTTFLVLNADLLTGTRFSELVAAHRRCHNDLTMATYEVDVSVRYGVVDVQGDAVRSLSEKPTLRLRANAGMYVLEPSVLMHVPRARIDMPEVVTSAIAAGMRVGQAEIRDVWVDIGELADLQRADDVYARLRAPGDR